MLFHGDSALVLFRRHFRLSLDQTIFIATFSISIILWLLHKFSNICKSEEGWYGQPKYCYKKTIHVVPGISFAVVFLDFSFLEIECIWGCVRLGNPDLDFEIRNSKGEAPWGRGWNLSTGWIQIRISWISWLLPFTVRLGNPKKNLQNYSRGQRSCFC